MLTLYANTGDDVLPVWKEIGENDCIFATGIMSTDSLAKPIIRPEAGYVWNEEMWIGPRTFTPAEQVIGWTKPSAPVQSGLIFKALFDCDCNAAPFVSAYDTESCDKWEKLILAGTKISKFKSLIKAYICGRESSYTAPPANWTYCDSGVLGNMNPNSLKGNESFVTVPFIPKAGDDFVFTLALSIPADAEHGRDDKFDPVITITFVHV
jgi:hypothetical protein